MSLTAEQRELLLEVHDAYEGTYGGGLLVGSLGERLRVANELQILGLIERHPPDRPVLIIPTGVGRERVADIRKRQKAARKGARKKARGK